MNIFKLHRTGEIDWDEYIGFVVRAHDEYTARLIACENDRHLKEKWLDEDFATCELIPEEGEEGIILDSYNAG